MIVTIVKHKDGTETKAQIWASTEVAFERKFQIPWSEAFSKPFPYQEYMYYAAYHAIVEEGRTGLDFDAWMKTVHSVGVEADEENPSNPAP